MKEISKKDKKFMDSLKWYVLNYEHNSDKIIFQNIFEHYWVCKRTPEELKNFVTYEKFKENMSTILMSEYSSRAECEFVAKGMFSKDKEYKISMWNQIEPNLDNICHYIIDKWNDK